MKAAVRNVVLAGGLAALAGCMSAPVPGNPTVAWVPESGARRPDAVWADLRARQPDLSTPLTLADVADMALQHNPATRRAWSEARAAAEQVQQAQGLFMPAVVASGAASRQRTDADPDSFDQDYLKYGPGLQLNYLVFNFGGGRRAAVDQALQTVYARNFTFNQTIQDVLFAAESAYYGAVSAQAGVAAAESGVTDARAALEAARARRDAGTGTELDALQAQAASDRAAYALAGAQGQQAVAFGALARAMGLPADAPVRLAAGAEEPVPASIADTDVRRLVDVGLARRPDIAALRAALAARQAAVKVTGSSLWPSLYLNGAVSRDYYDTIGGKDFQARDWAYGGGVSLQWTVFDGLQTVSARRAALAQAQSAEAQLRETELAAAAEVWSRYQEYETAVKKCASSEAYLASASRARDLAFESYGAGVRSILDLLTAESALAQARSQRVAARQEAFAALAGLARAAGLLDKGGAAHTRESLSTSTRKDDQP